MTTTPARLRADRLRPPEVPAVIDALESDFGRLPPGQWDPRHHYLLDALDRGDHARFVVAGADRPMAVAHMGATGTVVPAGDPSCVPLLAPLVERARWRILIGDEAITRELVDASSGSWWRRRPTVRVQRFMTAVPDGVRRPSMPLEGFRRAGRHDLAHLEEFACRLHVEDRMGPALTGPSRHGVGQRMADSVERGMTWVVQRGGRPVGKVDLSLYSPTRGAQIAGVYVEASHRGRGIGAGMIATLAADLMERGLPVVSLHVRDDNTPAIAAYVRAGFTERGRWLLALR